MRLTICLVLVTVLLAARVMGLRLYVTAFTLLALPYQLLLIGI
jgi:hypothetical protein